MVGYNEILFQDVGLVTRSQRRALPESPSPRIKDVKLPNILLALFNLVAGLCHYSKSSIEATGTPATGLLFQVGLANDLFLHMGLATGFIFYMGLATCLLLHRGFVVRLFCTYCEKG